MAKQLAQIDDDLAAWLRKQHLFFVATAPLAGDGLVNCSPKGLDTFTIIDPLTVAYLDLTGSGVETIAHVRENGRIVLMFCAFDGAPRVVRLHGTGTVFEPGDAGYEALAGRFPPLPGARAVIQVAVSRVSTSCGFGVPYYEFVGDRSALVDFAEKKGPDGMLAYNAKHNRRSLDGLPGVQLNQAAAKSSD